MPALTTLYLRSFVFRGGDDGRAEPFTALKRLNSINHLVSRTTLVSLTIHRVYLPGDYSTIELHAPSLCLFAFTGTPPFQKLSGSHLSSIQQVNIDADMVSKIKPPLVPLSWLIQLPNIKSLTVFAKVFQVDLGSGWSEALKAELAAKHNGVVVGVVPTNTLMSKLVLTQR